MISLLLLALGANEPGASTTFTHETVAIHIDADRIYVSGDYVFGSAKRNDAIAILYPFANDPSLGRAEILEANPDNGLRDATGLHVLVPTDEVGQAQFRIGYRQFLFGRRATYLLTSTKEWGRPLEHATLVVDWLDSMGTPRFSFPLRAVSRANGRTRYQLDVDQFYPDHDLVVTW